MSFAHIPAELRLAGLLAAFAMAGCGGAPDESAPAEVDPMEMQALNDPIMVDLDLASRNEGNMALSGNLDHSLPPQNDTRDAKVAAIEEAAVIVGGITALEPLPEAVELGGEVSLTAGLTAVARAKADLGTPRCAAALRYSTIWAARMPEAVPIYPRGSTQEAAGTDANGCALRVVNFLTPVERIDVLRFYATIAKRGNYDATLETQGDEMTLRGTKRNAAFAVYARALTNGSTQVDLVTRGGL